MSGVWFALDDSGTAHHAARVARLEQDAPVRPPPCRSTLSADTRGPIGQTCSKRPAPRPLDGSSPGQATAARRAAMKRALVLPAVLLTLPLVALFSARPPSVHSETAATYVGSETCKGCHED